MAKKTKTQEREEREAAFMKEFTTCTITPSDDPDGEEFLVYFSEHKLEVEVMIGMPCISSTLSMTEKQVGECYKFFKLMKAKLRNARLDAK